ncbi:MAG: hypothetical protein IPM92_15825 [Saprospiraceae bacterium]|nr:hypothetical protein [Saprospiraceae bacterium]
MKNLNWALHAVSILGLIFLFVQNQQLKSGKDKLTPATTSSGGGDIAYFQSDSLLPNLNFSNSRKPILRKNRKK